jgi:hypothetical protein
MDGIFLFAYYGAVQHIIEEKRMSIFHVPHDEADVRILLCVREDNLTEAEIIGRHKRLYPPCLVVAGKPLLHRAKGEKDTLVLHQREFDVKSAIATAVRKGFIAEGKRPYHENEADTFFVTNRGREIIAPKEKKKTPPPA